MEIKQLEEDLRAAAKLQYVTGQFIELLGDLMNKFFKENDLTDREQMLCSTFISVHLARIVLQMNCEFESPDKKEEQALIFMKTMTENLHNMIHEMFDRCPLKGVHDKEPNAPTTGTLH